MPQITIRNLPEETRKLLVQEARSTHRSTAALIRSALEAYAEAIRRRRQLAVTLDDMKSLRERIRRRRGVTSDSAHLQRQDRER